MYAQKIELCAELSEVKLKQKLSYVEKKLETSKKKILKLYDGQQHDETAGVCELSTYLSMVFPVLSVHYYYSNETLIM